MPRRIRLTPELRQGIVAAIRAGADPRSAAQAWDLPLAVFEEWLARGEETKAREPYRSFAEEIRAARAQARTKAEIEVFQKAPKVWLEHGPGNAAAQASEGNALLNRSLMELFHALLEALTPYPEARACAARVLAGSGFGARRALPPPSAPPG